MDTEKIDKAFEVMRHLRLPDFILPYRELPNEVTASIERLIDTFASASSTERESMAQRVEASFAFVFPRYAQRAAVESVRLNVPEFLKRGLIALAIENAKVDWRDTLPFLAFLYNSARKLNVDGSELFRDTARIACPPFRRLLEAFLGGDEESRTVQSFHYKEVGERSSFTYVYVEPPSHPPSQAEWKIQMFFRRLQRVFRR